MAIEVMGTMRHACAACSGSCRGVVVRLDEEETERVVRLARALGVENPIVDSNALRRTEAGACVFLREDGLCSVHAAFGAEAKPSICLQYPLVAVRTESGLRVGLDPGCYAHAELWQTAPEVEWGSLKASVVEYEPRMAMEERAILQILDVPDQTVAGALRALLRRPPAETLPEPFAARWLAHLKGVSLGASLVDPSLGSTWRDALLPLSAALEVWDTPPPWGISAEADAFAVDAAKRLIHLRLVRRLGSPAGAALMMLAGAIAVGWAAGGDQRAFGRGLAGWSRLLRSPKFLAATMPDQAGLMRLVS